MLVYCSFASETDCLGVCVLETDSDNPMLVSMLAHMLGINPGGELLCVALPEGLPGRDAYASNVGRLIPKEEARELFGAKSIREHDADFCRGLS